MPIIPVLPIKRRRCQLTQEKLAQLSGRSAQLICKLEQNKSKGIGFDTVSQICEVLEADLCEVVVYVPDDVNKLDDALVKLARNLDCSVEEILPCLPKELLERYRKRPIYL